MPIQLRRGDHQLAADMETASRFAVNSVGAVTAVPEEDSTGKASGTLPTDKTTLKCAGLGPLRPQVRTLELPFSRSLARRSRQRAVDDDFFAQLGGDDEVGFCKRREHIAG